MGWWKDTPGSHGNHAGSIFEDNHIQSFVADKLGFGLLVGSHPWDPSNNVFNTNVNHNTISGATINVMIEGVFAGANIGDDNQASGHVGTRTVDQACSQSADYTKNPTDSFGNIAGDPKKLKYHGDTACCELESDGAGGWQCKQPQ